LGDLTYCWAHWIIAVYYKKIANNMPRVIMTSREELVPVKRYRYHLWVGLAYNTIGPIGEGLTLYPYLHHIHQFSTVSFWAYVGTILSSYVVYTGQVVSGI
jgi:hypothetical protein